MRHAFTLPGKVLILLTCTLAAALALLPLTWLVSTSLKDRSDVFAVPPQFVTLQPTLENYAYVWSSGGVQQYFVNSAIVSAGTVLLNVGCATLAGYALARIPVRGRAIFFTVVVGTMLVPFPSIMLSLFTTSRDLGLYGTHLGVMLPLAAVYLWLSIYIMKEAFAALPMELEEAAKLDGCNQGWIFLRVMVPLVKAPMATAAILVFTLTWSEFLWPLLILREQQDFTISIGLQYFLSALTSNWHHIAAVAVLASAPTVIVFLALQRFFFNDTLAGATKG